LQTDNTQGFWAKAQQGSGTARLVEFPAQDLQFKSVFLTQGIQAAREKFRYTPSRVIEEMLIDSPLFREDRREFFERGLAAYESGDYLKAIHVLVPQVEYMLRELLGIMGISNGVAASSVPSNESSDSGNT
jgi:hypothetical protein